MPNSGLAYKRERERESERLEVTVAFRAFPVGRREAWCGCLLCSRAFALGSVQGDPEAKRRRDVEKQRRVTTLWIWISHGNHAAIILPRPVFGSAPSSRKLRNTYTSCGAVPTESFYRKSGPRRSLVAKDNVGATLHGKSSRHNGKIHPRGWIGYGWKVLQGNWRRTEGNGRILRDCLIRFASGNH